VRDPFYVEGPACVSFSGGRTSAYMLRRILDAHHGTLPADVHVLFANTGREREETLDFVRECGVRWEVRVRWVEYRNFLPFARPWPDAPPRWLRTVDGRAPFQADLFHTFREVDHASASRDGEPFEALIEAWRHLPNPTQRVCTQGLKLRPMKEFARNQGFDHWTSVVGLRADEIRRVRNATAPTRERWEVECPLAEANVMLADVSDFWRSQPFDLQLRPDEGNCDLCFMKGKAKILRLIRARPSSALWWIQQETRPFGKPGDARFRHDRPPYARLLAMVQDQPLLPGIGLEGDDALPCACTD
jgi:hypothetical protein